MVLSCKNLEALREAFPGACAPAPLPYIPCAFLRCLSNTHQDLTELPHLFTLYRCLHTRPYLSGTRADVDSRGAPAPEGDLALSGYSANIMELIEEPLVRRVLFLDISMFIVGRLCAQGILIGGEK